MLRLRNLPKARRRLRLKPGLGLVLGLGLGTCLGSACPGLKLHQTHSARANTSLGSALRLGLGLDER